MAGEQEPRVYTATPEDRQAEQSDIQHRETTEARERVHDTDREAAESVLEYERQLGPLLEYIKEIDTWMHQMRGEGIPDVQEYEMLRKRLTDAYEKASALHIRVGEIADGLSGASAEVQQNAERVSAAQRSVFEHVEDAFQSALGTHDAWLKAHAGEMQYGRRENDFGPYVERLLAPEFYDQRVMKLQEQTAAIEEDVDAMKEPTPGQVADVISRIEQIRQSLIVLDGKTESPHQSRERKSLVGMLDALVARLDAMPASAESEEHLPELEPLLTPQEYDSSVNEMIGQVNEWEKIADTLESAGKLTKEVRADILDELRKYPAQLYELDDRAENPDASVQRTALIQALQELRNRLSDEFYVSEKKNPGISPVAAVRDVYRRVKASYADVQHTLTVDQRREMRTHIATLSSLVRLTEEERTASVRTAVAASVARATEHAPAIAHVAFRSK